MLPDTESLASDAPATTGLASDESPPKVLVGRAGGAVRKPPDSHKVAPGWWPAAIVSIAVAAALSVVVARGADLDTAHRAAAAATALLVVAALAVLAQVILLWYQARMIGATRATPIHPTLAFRRRGLKAAIIGQDGRASTSKTPGSALDRSCGLGVCRSAPARTGIPQRKPVHERGDEELAAGIPGLAWPAGSGGDNREGCRGERKFRPRSRCLRFFPSRGGGA